LTHRILLLLEISEKLFFDTNSHESLPAGRQEKPNPHELMIRNISVDSLKIRVDLCHKELFQEVSFIK